MRFLHTAVPPRSPDAPDSGPRAMKRHRRSTSTTLITITPRTRGGCGAVGRVTPLPVESATPNYAAASRGASSRTWLALQARYHKQRGCGCCSGIWVLRRPQRRLQAADLSLRNCERMSPPKPRSHITQVLGDNLVQHLTQREVAIARLACSQFNERLCGGKHMLSGRLSTLTHKPFFGRT